MKMFNKINAVNIRLLAEVSASGFLAFIMVSVVHSATSPAVFSLSNLVTMV